MVSSSHFLVGHFRTWQGLAHEHGGDGGEDPLEHDHLNTQVVVPANKVSSTHDSWHNIFSRSSRRTGSSCRPECSRYLGTRSLTPCRLQKGASRFPKSRVESWRGWSWGLAASVMDRVGSPSFVLKTYMRLWRDVLGWSFMEQKHSWKSMKTWATERECPK